MASANHCDAGEVEELSSHHIVPEVPTATPQPVTIGESGASKQAESQTLHNKYSIRNMWTSTSGHQSHDLVSRAALTWLVDFPETSTQVAHTEAFATFSDAMDYLFCDGWSWSELYCIDRENNVIYLHAEIHDNLVFVSEVGSNLDWIRIPQEECRDSPKPNSILKSSPLGKIIFLEFDRVVDGPSALESSPQKGIIFLGDDKVVFEPTSTLEPASTLESSPQKGIIFLVDDMAVDEEPTEPLSETPDPQAKALVVNGSLGYTRDCNTKERRVRRTSCPTINWDYPPTPENRHEIRNSLPPGDLVYDKSVLAFHGPSSSSERYRSYDMHSAGILEPETESSSTWAFMSGGRRDRAIAGESITEEEILREARKTVLAIQNQGGIEEMDWNVDNEEISDEDAIAIAQALEDFES